MRREAKNTRGGRRNEEEVQRGCGQEGRRGQDMNEGGRRKIYPLMNQNVTAADKRGAVTIAFGWEASGPDIHMMVLT